jgi:hypothetical protein
MEPVLHLLVDLGVAEVPGNGVEQVVLGDRAVEVDDERPGQPSSITCIA